MKKRITREFYRSAPPGVSPAFPAGRQLRASGGLRAK